MKMKNNTLGQIFFKICTLKYVYWWTDIQKEKELVPEAFLELTVTPFNKN